MFSYEDHVERSSVDLGGYPMVNENSLLPIITPVFVNVEVLGVMEAIKSCESNGNPNVCNKEYGCKGGQGLYQIIPSTLRYCEEKLGEKLDVFNPQDNERCAYWLAENEGFHHWGTEDTWWGSYRCWSKVL